VTGDLAALARSVFCVGYPGDGVPAGVREELRAFGPGAIILFARNLGPNTDVRETVSALRGCGDIAPLIAVDQEGGRVARIADPALVAQLPSAMALAAAGDDGLCERAGRLVGSDLARLGISVNFAPCADLALDARNTVIGARSFGDAPHAVAARVTAFARGLEAGGVAATLKHFPGHGATAVDSHVALPHVDAAASTLRARDLVPFAAAISSAAASIVMTAHVVYDALDPTAPATLSDRLLRGLLRGELAFDGVVATDCLEMDAIAATVGTADGAVRALSAGADLLLVSHHLDVARAAAAAIVAAIEGGSLAPGRLVDAARRVGSLRERFAAMSPPAIAREAGLGLEVAQRAVTIVRGDVRLRADEPVTVVSFEGTIADGAVDARATLPSLSAALRARRWRSEHLRVALEPQADELELLIAHVAAQAGRNVVAVVRRAHLYPAQRAAVDRLIALVPELVVVSAREPYDAACFPQARRLACIYGDEAVSLEGCADVLSGGAPGGGRLPVTIDRDAALR
jgi:beta-N-acetylhexosaminidase